ncbi:hypothetical protein JMUB6875_31730 [Nocardia sp. JMUB6875]|uniref:NUDIX domain-containing protein n=1 Tax=Nocardia sp. JMUB6875 TaxID=3158170 RepID=UPI0032E638E8
MNTLATEITARAVILRGGQILLADHPMSPAAVLPGLPVDPGAPLENALLKEVTEQLGVRAVIVRFGGVVEHRYTSNGMAHHELTVLLVVALMGEPHAAGFHWVSLAELDDTDIRPSVLKSALSAAEDPPGWWPWRSDRD